MITTTVTSCARCGLNHEAVVFTRFDRPPPDATHYGTCPQTQQPILMLVRETGSPTVSPPPDVPAYQFAYSLNVGLALYRSAKTNDASGVVLYGQKLLQLAMQWNAPRPPAGIDLPAK